MAKPRALLFNLGSTYRAMGRHEKATDYYLQALSIRRELGDRYGEVLALNSLGAHALALGRYEEALRLHEQALTITRELRNKRAEVTALLGLGHAHGNMGRPEKQRENYEQALSISRELKDRFRESYVLGSLSGVYSELGQYEKAIGHREQALSINRDLKDKPGEIQTLRDLGSIYRLLGRYERAIEFVEQSLALSRQIKARNREGWALSALGQIHSALGRHKKAVELHRQALAISRELKEPAAEAYALDDLGDVHIEMGRASEAIKYLEDSLAISVKIKNREGEVYARDNLGVAYYKLGRYDRAVEYHEQTLAIAREVKSRVYEASALNNLMLAWKARGKLALAVFCGKQAVNIFQEIRGNISSLEQESQKSYAGSKEGTYRTLADLLISLGRLPEAEQVINLLKQEEYFEFVSRDQSAAPSARRSELTEEEKALERRYREIADRVAEIGAERGALVGKKDRTAAEDERLAKLDADLVVAGQTFQKFLSQMERELGAAPEAGAQVYHLRESQGMMEDLRELGEGAVALYTLVGDDKYRVILTTPDVQKGFEYPVRAADLNRKVLAFREALQDPKADPLPLAQELYRILVGPAARDLERAKAKTLMWSLDGVLRYLPVAALHDGRGYTVERYRNVVFTPASQARLKDAPSARWTALGLGVTKSHGERVPALPGVLEEMRGIIREGPAGGAERGAEVAGVLPGTIRLDEQFTQEAMLAELRRRPPVVHIASHFQFRPGSEAQSALLLGDGNFMSLAQIKSLPNVFGGVELLTLSACNTATGGGGANGKEVEGFGVLAQRQGAKSVVASLWPVADRSTKVLMQEFYRQRESRAGVTKAESLRLAQVALLRGERGAAGAEDGLQASRQIVHERVKAGASPAFKTDPRVPYAHPYFWAPFILIGNWR